MNENNNANDGKSLLMEYLGLIAVWIRHGRNTNILLKAKRNPYKTTMTVEPLDAPNVLGKSKNPNEDNKDF